MEVYSNGGLGLNVCNIKEHPNHTESNKNIKPSKKKFFSNGLIIASETLFYFMLFSGYSHLNALNKINQGEVSEDIQSLVQFVRRDDVVNGLSGISETNINPDDVQALINELGASMF
jgi:hypothetical protein